MSDVERRPWPRNPRYLVGADGTIIGPKGRALTGALTPRGYRFVGAPSRNRRSEYVHVMVCETFHGPRPAGKQAAHENGSVADCRAVNLSWKTPIENTADKIRHGTYTQGEDHAPAKLTEEQVREIRAAAGMSQTTLARRYGVTQSCISAIVTRTTWQHLPALPVESRVDVLPVFARFPGEQNARAKLTAQDVREIRTAYATGELQREIGVRYGVSQTTVGKIVRRAAWAHV